MIVFFPFNFMEDPIKLRILINQSPFCCSDFIFGDFFFKCKTSSTIEVTESRFRFMSNEH